MPDRQPFLHDLVTTFAAPTQVLSGRTGDIVSSAEGPNAQGIAHADVRVVSDLRVTVDGVPPEHIATTVDEGGTVFTGLLRQVGSDRAGGADPQIRLDRRRRVRPGVVREELHISSVLPVDATATLQVTLRSDFAPIERIKVGAGAVLVPLVLEVDGDMVSWRSGDLEVRLTAPGASWQLPDPESLELTWPLVIPGRGSVTVGLELEIVDDTGVVTAAAGPGLDVERVTADAAASLSSAGIVEPSLVGWLAQSLRDLNALRMTTVEDPGNAFFAAGAPWYLTLFGRDSLWTSRLLLPVDVGQAEGTLRTLGRLAGTRRDDVSAEAPGKIIHELRRGQYTFGETSLPPLYYGTIDATPLWICLLHDAWRAGLDPDVVTDLLPTLQAALEWLVSTTVEGGGFCTYLDASGTGLANQGWKDSDDAVRFADGTLARGSVALCEVQGYAYEAAMSGAALLDAFSVEGGDGYRSWAADLADRFRRAFWCGSGADRYPAIALDGDGRQVDAVTSNIGHLLGTGILDADEERVVAERVTAADLDSGLGLRTMSSAAAGYSPLSYHCGSVWPHDTAIVIAGLVRAGFSEQASGLVDGLLRASVAFDQRLPELWSGEGAPVPYPAACRPQAWSAASAVTVLAALTTNEPSPLR